MLFKEALIVQRLFSMICAMEYIYIDTDEALHEAVLKWKELECIAVDFEGEFNLHIYGEHLCLIQVYDGSGYSLIDPRSHAITKQGLEEFFSIETEKVWFECQSDASLVFKQYGLRIRNIVDIRVMAKALGYQGNLSGLEEKYLGIKDDGNKKKHQQANWLKRPFDQEEIEYALKDVEYLIALRSILEDLVREKHLEKHTEAMMRKATQVTEGKPGWTKVCSWRMLGSREREYVKAIYLARDAIARRFNVPAVRVMDKHRIAELAMRVPRSRDELSARLKDEPPRFRKMLIENTWNAIERVSGNLPDKQGQKR